MILPPQVIPYTAFSMNDAKHFGAFRSLCETKCGVHEGLSFDIRLHSIQTSCESLQSSTCAHRIAASSVYVGQYQFQGLLNYLSGKCQV
jgi:hypothetical protein